MSDSHPFPRKSPGLALALLAAVCAGPTSAAHAAIPSAQQDGSTPQEDSSKDSQAGRRSLEDLLREVRQEHGLSVAKLRPKVLDIINEMDALRASRTGNQSNAKVAALGRLGRPALELVVRFIEPGKNVTRQTVFRAQLIAGFLRDHPDPTTTDRLLRIAREGTIHGRLGALEALETSPEPARVTPTLIEVASGNSLDGLTKDDKVTVIKAAFCTLAMQKDARAQAFIAGSLDSTDTDLCAGALAAMAEAPPEGTSSQVLTFLTSLAETKPENAKDLGSAIADYYEQHEELLEDLDHARALAAVAVLAETPSEARSRMFDTLRVTDAKVGTKAKRAIEPFADVSRPGLRMSARLLLARLKDRGAKRDLLSPFDDQIKRNKNSISAHSDRAKIYHSIGDWGAAERDWRFVMSQMANDEITRSRKEPFIGIARALARLKKFREAASYLSQGPISVEELQDLGNDRDFRAMRDSRYGDVFQFGDD